MNPKLRIALTHLGTAGGAALATFMWLATKGVDLSAIVDQLNTVVAEITKLIAMATPIATTAFAVWKSTRSKLQEAENDSRVEGIIVNDPKLAASLGPKVQTTVQALPSAAKDN